MRAASVREAHVRYNARDTEEGRRAHQEEEQKRRGAKGVGDHRCGGGVVELEGSPAAVSPGKEIDEERSRPVSVGPAAAIAAPAEHAASDDAREWVLVAWPEVLEEARARLGREAVCRFCGRSGRIVRVVAREEWRRRYHRRVE